MEIGTETPAAHASPAAPAAPAAAPASKTTPAAPDASRDGKPTPEAKPAAPAAASPAKPAAEKPAYRSLEELKQASAGGRVNLSKVEQERVRFAARNNLHTDAEIDEAMAKKGAPGAPKQQPQAPAPKTLSKEGVPAAKPAAPAAPAAQQPANAEPTPPPAETGLHNETLTDLAKVIGKAPEDKEGLLRSMTWMKGRSDTLGNLENQFKAAGATGVEQGLEAIQTLDAIDTLVSEALDSEEGLKGLFSKFQKPIPAWLGGVSPAAPAAAGAPPAASPAGAAPAVPAAQGGAVFAEIEALSDEGLVDARTLKGLAGKLQGVLQQQQADFQRMLKEATDPFGTKFDQLGKTLQPWIEKTEMENALSEAMRDVRLLNEHGSQFGDWPALKATPEDIWAQSFAPDGTLLPTPHPEFETLKAMVEVRKEAKAAGVSPLAFLGERYLRTGKLLEIKRQAAAAGAQDVLKSQVKILQPALQQGGGAVDTQTFDKPLTKAEVDNLAKTNPAGFKAYKAWLKKGGAMQTQQQ